MKKIRYILFFVLMPMLSFAQKNMFSAVVFDVQTQQPINNVNVLNINQVRGAISNDSGQFVIDAFVGDTLHISCLGYKQVKIVVNKDMLRFKGTRIGMSQITYNLEEVVVTPYQLTGYLSVDVKNLPEEKGFQYSISGLELGYEGQVSKNILSRISDPVGLLYSVFSTKNSQLKKLKKWKEQDHIKDMLIQRYDRQLILSMLEITKEDLEKILRECNYSSNFIATASDLQVLEAVEACFEEHNILSLKKKVKK